jgi:hypothetical protein
MTKDQKYQALLAEAQADPNIIGLILGGGRGKGQFTEYSDYDVEIIVTDPVAAQAYKKFEEKDVIDSINPMTLEQFRAHAAWGAHDAWDRYTYTHNKAVIDKTGDELQKLIDEKGAIPSGKEGAVVEENVGGYMNAVYRTLKNFRDGNILASKLDAVESIPWLLAALFATENRLRPYNKFLRWELEQYPLSGFPIATDEFLKQIETIISSGDIATQKTLFKTCLAFFRAKGFTQTINSWEGYRFE